MIRRCANCLEIKREDQLSTVMSMSSTGAMILVHICKICAGNNEILKRVIDKQDLKLIELDSKIKFKGVQN